MLDATLSDYAAIGRKSLLQAFSRAVLMSDLGHHRLSDKIAQVTDLSAELP